MLRWFVSATNDNETKENIAYAIRLGSNGIDDLSRGTTHTDDDRVKVEKMEFSKANILFNDFGDKIIMLGFRVEAEFVPNPSLYSPVNVNYITNITLWMVDKL